MVGRMRVSISDYQTIPVVAVTRQGLAVRNPKSGWPLALSVAVSAMLVCTAALRAWHSAADGKALGLVALLTAAAAVSGRLSFRSANTMQSAPWVVYVVCAAILLGPLGAILAGAAAAAAALTSPPEAQLFNASIGAIQGATAAAAAVRFGGAGLSSHLLGECAAVAAAAVATWGVGQLALHLVRGIPLQYLRQNELPAALGELLVAVGAGPAMILLYRDASLLALGMFAATLIAAFAVFRSYRRRLLGLNAEVERLSRSDALTGTGNRRAFDERLEQECSRSQRSGRPFALLLIDLDKLKQINDTHGHLAGDRALREVTARLRSRLRREDQLARIGGDEFAVIATETPDTYAIEQLAAALNEATSSPVTYEHTPINATISIGACLADDQPQPQQLLRLADTALFQAKQAGGNRFTIAGSGVNGVTTRV
jgi:diguanylate cyclase (GGDEF)-like protein